jgi:hypothetical protein
MEECGDMCCGSGNYCSKYGCIQRGSIECGDWSCPPGNQCSRMHSRCIPAGQVDCGTYYCSPGNKCGSNNNCIPEDAADCGSGKGYCTDGKKCSRDGKRCLVADAVDCGASSCNAGQKCGSGNQCLARTDVDCGGGKSCREGTLCVRGGAECLTRQEIADRAAAEKKKRDDEFAERKRQIEAKRLAEIEAKAKAAEERRLAVEADAKRKADEAAKKAAEAETKRKAALEAKQRADEARRLVAEAEATRKAEEIAKAKALKEEQEAQRLRKQLDAKIDKDLETIAKDTKQSPAYRAIAAIGLGKDPASFGIPNTARAGNSPAPPTQAERELAMLAVGKTLPEKLKQSRSNVAPLSIQERLQTILENPKESEVSRKIAAVALGKDSSNLVSNPTTAQPVAPKAASTQPQPAPSTTVPGGSVQPTNPASPKPSVPADAQTTTTSKYTFAQTPYGTVEVFQDGKRIGTGTPEYAAQYGYKPGSSAPQTGTQAAPVASTQPPVSQTGTQNPPSASTQPPTPSSSSSQYTFAQTPYGTIEVFQGGKRIGTGTAEYAAQYGYKPPGSSGSQMGTAVAPPANAVVAPGSPSPAQPSTSQTSSTAAVPSQGQNVPQTATNTDVRRLLSDPTIGISGNYGRTVNGSVVDLRTGAVVATGGVTTAAPPQQALATPPTPSSQNGAASQGYNFKPTAYGTVEISKNGQRIATSTPQYAAQQYGYQIPSASVSPKPTVALSSAPVGQIPTARPAQQPPSSNVFEKMQPVTPATNSTFATNVQPVKGVADLSPATNGIGSVVTAVTDKAQSAASLLNQFYQTPVGRAVVDTTVDVGAAAGGAAAPKWAGNLGKINDAGNYMVLVKQGDWLGVAQATVDWGTVKAATLAGGYVGAEVGTVTPGVGPAVGAKVGSAVGAGTAQLALDIGKYSVAPALGNVIYYLDQQPMRSPTGVWQPPVPPTK